MADCHIVVVRVIGRLEQREVHNPSEGEIVGLEQARAAGKLDTHGAQQFLGGGAATGCEEHGVAVFGADGFLQTVAFLFGQVLGDGALEFAVLGEHHIGEALGAHAAWPNPAMRRTDGEAWPRHP